MVEERAVQTKKWVIEAAKESLSYRIRQIMDVVTKGNLCLKLHGNPTFTLTCAQSNGAEP